MAFVYIILLLFVVQRNVSNSFAFNTPLPPSSSALDPFSTSKSKLPPFQLQKLDHIVIRCHDFPKMFDFYTNVLGCTIDEPIEENVNRFDGVLTHLRAGDAYIDLLAYDFDHVKSKEGKEALLNMHSGGKGHIASSSNYDLMKDISDAGIHFSSDASTLDHVCIRIDSFDEESITHYFKNLNIKILSSGNRKGADGVGPSVYVQDPEGNVIELKGPSISIGSKEKSESNKKSLIESESVETNNGHKVKDESPLSLTNKIPSNKSQTESSISTSFQSKTKSNDYFQMTPCTRICRYNANFYDGQVCIGCYREAYEISTWNSMTHSERSYALLDAADRCEDRQSDENNNQICNVFEGSVSRNDLKRQAEAWAKKAETQE